MRPITAVLLLGLLIGFGAAPVGAEQKPVTLYAVNFPPYEIENPTNGLSGFDVEVVSEAFRRIGMAIRIEFRPWKRVLMMVRTGEGLGALTCRDYGPRLDWAVISEPISEATYAFVMDNHFAGAVPQTLDDLIGLDVVAVRGYATTQQLDDLGIDNTKVDTIERALLVLVRRHLDVLYNSLENTQYLAKQLGLAGHLRFIPVAEAATVPYHICFSKKWPGVEGIVSRFNAALKELRESGVYEAIHAKYR